MTRRSWAKRFMAAVAGIFGVSRAATTPAAPVAIPDGFGDSFWIAIWIPDESDPKCHPIPREVNNGIFLGNGYLTGCTDSHREFKDKNPGWICAPAWKLIQDAHVFHQGK